jgi:putative ATP-binding cassette transporter
LMVVVGAFSQVNQSLRWFVDNFALLAEWRAALFRVIRFREALLMSESGRERETATVHLRDFANRPRPHNPTLVKVLDDVA